MGLQNLSAKRRDLKARDTVVGEALRIQGNMSNQYSRKKPASTKGRS